MRFTPRRPWAPLSDAEWAALGPFLQHASPAGRPLELRARMDAIFHAAVSGDPWRLLPERFGKPDTISRHFRRLAHAGVWSRLLYALAHPAASPGLRSLEYWLCRAARRAMRLLRMGGLILARRLKLYSAMPMWPWLMPDVDLSEKLLRWSGEVVARVLERRPKPGLLTLIGRMLVAAGGRPVWSKRFAPECTAT